MYSLSILHYVQLLLPVCSLISICALFVVCFCFVVVILLWRLQFRLGSSIFSISILCQCICCSVPFKLQFPFDSLFNSIFHLISVKNQVILSRKYKTIANSQIHKILRKTYLPSINNNGNVAQILPKSYLQKTYGKPIFHR